MKAAEFQRWLAKLATLTAHQRESVERQLRGGDPRGATERLVEQLSGPVERCPHCGHVEV